MQRRDFLKSTVAAAVAAELGIGKAQAKVPAHNWGKFDFGSGPQVTDRLNQGPFPQYPPDAVIPTDDVVMTTTPSEDVVPNYGMGLVNLCHSRQGHWGNQVRQYSASDRGLSSFSIRPAGLHPPDVERSAAAARTPGVARLREAGF